MAITDLEKTLRRMKVTLKAVELAATPAHGFSPAERLWRCTLSRDVGEEKPARLTLTITSTNEPGLDEVITRLNQDVQDAEMTLWDFAQEYSKGKTTIGTESMYKMCKRISSRAQRFFGESWTKVSLKAA